MNIVGKAEIMTMLDVSDYDFEHKILDNYDFPKPKVFLKQGSVWDRGEVRRWAKRHNQFVIPEPDEITWPIITTKYMYSQKDDNYTDAIKLGLSEHRASSYSYLGMEVPLTVEIHEDGQVYVTKLGDVELVEKYRLDYRR